MKRKVSKKLINRLVILSLIGYIVFGMAAITEAHPTKVIGWLTIAGIMLAVSILFMIYKEQLLKVKLLKE